MITRFFKQVTSRIVTTPRFIVGRQQRLEGASATMPFASNNICPCKCVRHWGNAIINGALRFFGAINSYRRNRKIKDFACFALCLLAYGVAYARIFCYPVGGNDPANADAWICESDNLDEPDEGGGSGQVVTNYMFMGCTGCVQITVAEMRDFKRDTMKILTDLEDRIADALEQMNVNFGDGTYYQSLTNLHNVHFTCSHGSFTGSRVDYTYTVSGGPESHTEHTVGSTSSSTDRPLIRSSLEFAIDYYNETATSCGLPSVSWFSANNTEVRNLESNASYLCGVYQRTQSMLDSLLPNFDAVFTQIESDLQSARRRLDEADGWVMDVQALVRALPEEECKPVGYAPGQGGSEIDLGWAQEMLAGILSEIQAFRSDTNQRIDNINETLSLASSNLVSISAAVSVIADGFSNTLPISFDQNDYSWTNIYLHGDEVFTGLDDWSYNKSNILQRIELLLWSMTELNSGTNSLDNASAVQSASNSLQNVQSSSASFSNDVRSVSNTFSAAWGKVKGVFNTFHINPQGSDYGNVLDVSDMSITFGDRNFEIPVIKLSEDMEASKFSTVLSPIMSALWWFLAVLGILFYWIRFGKTLCEAGNKIFEIVYKMFQ